MVINAFGIQGNIYLFGIMLTIKSITPIGDIHSYDIINNDHCFDDEGNFFIDGVLVHNSTLRNGVRSFHDLMALSALGHPGPMQMIPEFVKRRDDPSQSWKNNENTKIAEILKDTHGIVVYQEQFTSLMQQIAGFSAPEAQDIRKAIAKKWKEKLKPVREKWISGSRRFLSESKATEWWDDILLPFGRYCFNKSHSVAYSLWAYRCLWLKAHFPEEWWASVMGMCDQKTLIRYMAAARSEGVSFGEIDIAKLTSRPTAHPGEDKHVALGLTSLKKVGDNIAIEFVDTIGNNIYTDIDDFIIKKGKSKILFERLIKLGAFKKIHPNIRATWMWYLHAYGTGNIEDFEFCNVDEQAKSEMAEYKAQQLKLKPNLKVFNYPVKILKNFHMRCLMNSKWTEESILIERNRQITDYKNTYPKRKIPAKILNYRPVIKAERDNIMALYQEDYSLQQILKFEKEFLGYYWHSPCDLYQASDDCTIEKAKANGCIEGVITEANYSKTKNGSDMLRLLITDGKKVCLILIWEQDIKRQNKKHLKVDQGVRVRVNYDPDRNSFTLKKGTFIEPLWSKSAWQKLQAESE
jgi:DNA polymerase III alpha subunit